MVFRRRLRNSLRPVNRIKHVVDIQGALTSGSSVTESIAIALDNPAQATAKDVENGSTINGFYLRVEVTRTGTTSDVLANVYFALWKNVANDLVLPASNVIGISDLKRYSIHQEMVMLQGTNAGNPRTMFVGVIAIPRGYRRNGPQDRWQVRITSPGVNINYCIQAIYKEFR